MSGHSKVTRTGSSGVSQGQSDDIRYRSSSCGSTASENGLASLGHGPPSNLDKLLGQLPPELRNTTWEVRNEVSKHLDPLKNPVGNDYRLVASRLGFSVEVIEGFGTAANPTLEMFKLCNMTSTKEFFRVLQEISRSDVIDDLLHYLTRNSNHYPLSTQESLEEEERLTHPLEESSSDVSKLSKQPSEQEDTPEENHFKSSEESRDFWNKIPGPYSRKKWPDFCAAMNEACPKESDHGGINKFLCHILKIDYDTRLDGEVRVEYFLRLLASFGPFKAGKDGCLEKMYELIDKSLSRSMDGKKHSWFAGYMNQQETEDKLQNLSPGHYLIRFSSSNVDEGWFILAVKTMHEVIQFEIKRDIEACKHLLADEPFPDLPSIVERLRREIFLEECPQLLINPCPDLPLNTNFNGYQKVTRKQRGCGRGKPR